MFDVLLKLLYTKRGILFNYVSSYGGKTPDTVAWDPHLKEKTHFGPLLPGCTHAYLQKYRICKLQYV